MIFSSTPELRYGLRLSGYARPRITGKLGSILKPGISNYRFNVGNQRRTVKTLTIDWNPIKTSKTNLTLVERQKKTPYLRKFVMGLMIAMPVISFFLGCWQVKRLEWKMDLIAKGENALAQPPIEKLPPNLDPESIKDFEYRRFRVKGHFDYDQEMFLGVRMREGTPGYLVVCPFIRSDGGKPILIERGWISKDKVIPDSRIGGPLEYMARPQGEIEIEAMFRIMPKKSSLQYEHEKGNRLFYVPDVEAMAEQSGSLPIYCQMLYDMSDKPEWKHNDKKSSLMDKILFFRKSNKESGDYIDFKNDNDATLEHQELEFVNGGVPIGTLPKVKYTNNHLQYLVTWFSLSAASTILLVYNIIKKRKYLSAEKVIEEKRKNMKQMW